MAAMIAATKIQMYSVRVACPRVEASSIEVHTGGEPRTPLWAYGDNDSGWMLQAQPLSGSDEAHDHSFSLARPNAALDTSILGWITSPLQVVWALSCLADSLVVGQRGRPGKPIAILPVSRDVGARGGCYGLARWAAYASRSQISALARSCVVACFDWP